MKTLSKQRFRLASFGAALTLAFSVATLLHTFNTSTIHSVIIQCESTEEVARAIESMGGEITHNLHIINSLGARLTTEQIELVENLPGVIHVHEDSGVKTADVDETEMEQAGVPYLDFPSVIDAHTLHSMDIDGTGITVAVLDSGIMEGYNEFKDDHNGQYRLLASYSSVIAENDPTNVYDGYGHGSHVSSIILNSEGSMSGEYNSIAPGVNLVAVKAFSADGWGTYADVILGLQWVLDNRELYNIRVLNMSFSAEPVSHYWDDPLNQAVRADYDAKKKLTQQAVRAMTD